MQQFFSFIRKMEQVFGIVQRGMDYINPNSTHHAGDDIHSVGWAGQGMMPIAVYLYYLKQKGVSGGVLECGVFKGGSTCCLSHICDYLGIQLFAADSFQGLPDGDDYYEKGDFRGDLQEVQDNLKKYGKPKTVTWIKGWFSESLQGFNEQLMLIWLDVDLRQSVIDVLDNCFDCLGEHGVIFSDGLGEHRDFDGEYLYPGSSESRGLLDFLASRNLSHKAVYSGYGHMGLVVPGLLKEEHLLYSPNLMKNMLFAARSRRDQLRILKKRIFV